MSGLDPSQIVNLVDILVILAGIGILWAVYYGSDRAELPGTALIPAPGEPDDAVPDTTGRTL